MTGLWPARWGEPAAGVVPPAQPLVLTAALPPAVQGACDAARRQLYPEGAKRAPAHLTLFRHLPGLLMAQLLHDMRALAAATPAPGLRLGAPRTKNDALSVPVESPGLDDLRADLADRWHGLLAPGDLVSPLLHITIAGPRATATGAIAPLPGGQLRCPGLLLWLPGGYGEACWRPLVACRFPR
jgi:hypothetical protein